MLEKLQEFLKRHIHRDYAYLITCAVYIAIVYAVIIPVALFYNFIPFIVLSFFIFEPIRRYSGGFHMHTNFLCICFTIPLIITFSYIAKQTSTETTLWVAFLICIICMKDLYHKAPLFYEDTPLEDRWYNTKPFDKIKLNRDKLNVEYDSKWHRKRALISASMGFLLSILFFTIEEYQLSSYTLWCIIMADMLLFQNID